MTRDVLFDESIYQDINIVEEIPNYVAPLIGSSCFLIILILFSILFHKRKKRHD